VKIGFLFALRKEDILKVFQKGVKTGIIVSKRRNNSGRQETAK
jgi:hypothetical protein